MIKLIRTIQKLMVTQSLFLLVAAVIDRDYNAALNILDEGIRIIGSSTTEYTLVDYPLVDDKVATLLKSNGRLKQENHKERMLNFVQL